MPGGPKIPIVPAPLPASWRPDRRLAEHPDVRSLAESGDMDAAVSEFRAFCSRHRLQRASWGHTFRTWLAHRHDPDFKIVRGGGPP